MDVASIIGGWVAAALTLAILSFLYRDNPLFKVAEHVFVGVTVGYTLVVNWYQYLEPMWWTPLALQRDPMALIPTAFSLMILARFLKPISWLSRYAMALMIGFGAGVLIPRVLSEWIFAQLQGTVVPLVSRTPGGAIDTSAGALWASFSALVILVGTVATLVYFFFSIEHKGPVKVVSRMGIYFLMLFFGASFGYTVMGRNALLFGRFYDLKTFAGAGYGHATWVLIAVIVVGLAVWARTFGRRGPTDPAVS